MIFVLIGFWCPVSFAKVFGFTDLSFWMLHRFSQMRCANTVWLVGEQLLADATVVPRVAVHALNCIFFWGGGGKERRRDISVVFYLFFFFRWFEGFSASVPLCTLDPVFHPDWNPWIAELAEVFACIFLCFSMVMCIKNFMETHDVTESCLVVIEGKWIRNVLFHRFQWWFKDIQGIYSRILSLKLIPHYVKRENLGTLGRVPFCPLYVYIYITII